MTRMLPGKLDHEPLTPEAQAAIERAEEQFRRGEYVTFEGIKRENEL